MHQVARSLDHLLVYACQRYNHKQHRAQDDDRRYNSHSRSHFDVCVCELTAIAYYAYLLPVSPVQDDDGDERSNLSREPMFVLLLLY